MIIIPDTFTAVHRAGIIDLAARLRLPAVYFQRFFAADGGLLSYGVDMPARFRRAGEYSDRILRGATHSDPSFDISPHGAPDKLELVINQRTAKALDLTIPASLLARADEVID